MFDFVGLPLAAALGLAAWPAIVNVRVRRWGQALLLIAASAAAPYAGLILSLVAMADAIERMPFIGVIPFVFLAIWIAAIVVPIGLGFIFHLLGRYTPPPPQAATEARGWRTPDA